jgi:hypothetical protein
MPEFDTVIAITSGTEDLQGVLNLIWDRILPALGASALPADADGDRKLSEKVATLSLRLQSGQPLSPMAEKVTARIYTFPSNARHIETVSLKTAGGGAGPSIAIRLNGVDQTLECGQGSWAKGSIMAPSGHKDSIATSGAWSSEDTYSIRLVHYLTPYSTDYDLRFAGDQLILEAIDNVGLTAPPTRIRLVGTAQP